MKLEENYLMSQITTLGIGGPAQKFVSVSSSQQLIEILSYAKQNQLAYLVIGGGSNLLVSDKGIDKLVIKNEVSGIEQLGNVLSVKSGTILQELVDYTIKNGLGGMNKLTGIPGTLGGAVFGNAGAYGHGISDYLVSVDAFNGEKIITFSKKECQFSYRNSGFKRNGYTILEIRFQLDAADPKLLKMEADNVLKQRLIKYPKGIKCPGSFFKNLVAQEIPASLVKNIPPDKIVYGKIPAGALLEMVGAKGDKLNGIEIAPYHANLFVNKGDGKAADFYTLAKKYALKVKEKFGIELEPEVQLINLPPL